MKRFALLPLFLIFGWVNAQDLDGAWKLTHQDGREITDEEYVKIYQDNYFAFGAKKKPTTIL